MVVSDPARHRQVSAATLEAVYALSPAEARVAALMAQATSLPEAARHLGISPNTAKTHAKRVFDKLGVSGQAELVLRVAGTLG